MSRASGLGPAVGDALEQGDAGRGRQRVGVERARVLILAWPGRNSMAAITSARPATQPPGRPPASTFASVVRSGVTP